MIELIGSFVNSESNKFFIEEKKAGNEKIIFNSSIIEKYYDGLSSTPFNYLTSFASNKPVNSFRVFLIGEASLSGWPYSIEHSIKRKLDKLFRGYLNDENIEIITISTAGFNSSQALDIIPQIIEFKPDLIILYTGHNEFYGYKGYSKISARSKSYLIDFVKNLLEKVGISNSIRYDKSRDDLEVLLPFNSDEKIITASQKEYFKIKNQFLSNINKIISICKENKTQLALTALSDNYLLPPIGVLSRKDDISADIIYNNARMALIRDGNQNTAIRLFKKSKDADAFRLRIPEDFIEDLKRVSTQNGIALADMKTEFARYSPNEIPGNDLFLDYIHPNSEGLNIIASVYAQIILAKYVEKTNSKAEIKPYRHFDTISKEDSISAKERIDKSLSLIKLFNNSQYFHDFVLK